jgi:hypothetical protein
MRLTTLNTLIATFTAAALAATLAGCDAPEGSDVDVAVGAETVTVPKLSGDSKDAIVSATSTNTSTTGTRTTAGVDLGRSTTPPLPPSPDPLPPTVSAISSGDGWRRVQVTGNAVDGETGAAKVLNDEYYVINGRDAIASADLSDQARAQLFGRLNGRPRPPKGEQEIIIVPKRLDDLARSGVSTFSLCDDDNNKVYSKTYAVDRTYPYHVSTEGSFSGSGDLNVHLKGSVTAAVHYDVTYTLCVPIPVLHSVSVSGSADVIADASLDAVFADKWSWSRVVAEPTIGTVTLPLVPIPLTFTAPITVGIDASAKAELHVHAGYEAHGAFSIGCNGDGCDGSKSATHSYTPNGSPSVNLSGKATVTPWVKGAVHARVVEDWLAFAEVGVKAKLNGQLWAQAGNSCGDGNHDGGNEYVQAATLDLGVGVDVEARAGFIFAGQLGPWTWNVWSKHLAFWSFGESSALSPIFYSAGVQSDALKTANMRASMRPCWPYKDAVTYRVTWNDGAVTTHSGAPGTLLTITHPYATYGTKVVHIEAVQDAAGRLIGGGADRSVRLSSLDPASSNANPGVLSP